MATILITGANKGLGRETARRLVREGHDVWAGARDPERGRLAAAEIGARSVVLDVTDDASVAVALETVAETTGAVLDTLINNAGHPGGITARELTAANLLDVYAVNVLGAVRILHAFLPLLERSSSAVIVNVSSGMGSLTVTSESQSPHAKLINPSYRSSKAALNMLTIEYAKAFPTMRINAVNPGYVATDFTGKRGASVERGAEVVVRMATIGPDGPTGLFVDEDGLIRGENTCVLDAAEGPGWFGA